MTTDNTDALRIVAKFVGAHNSSLDVCEFGERCDDFIEEARAVLVASLQAPPTQPQQAVACIGGNPSCPCQDGDACHYQDAADGTKAMPIQPHAPLSFDQLQRVMSQHFGGRELTDDEADSAEHFARAIERAHGITAKPQKEN